ncbi:ATP-binding protein [Haladaptatus pallidirubidus]|uniref:AAA+ ATPase domain-containing protein n=1 Tax=Haladaptatus pallidirubidus TaxID=1008152 RepID=A0AAV3UHP1_9EURY|nr:AAA family ATPase [Haladaptatus pallidirubidus]
MGNDRVLKVLAVEDQELLVNEDSQIILVRNEVSRQVTPGDFVEVESHIMRDKAVRFAREDEPVGQQALVEKKTDEYLLMQTESGKRILPNPDEEVSPGDGVLLTNLGEFYKVIEEDIVNFDDDDRESLLQDMSGTDSSDLEPENVPDKEYADFGGMDEVVEEVKYKVEIPLKEPERFEDVGMDAPKGVLFYGPSGTGKTYLAKIVANQVENASFYSIRGPELSHELVGGTERKLRGLFKNAQENPPAIIFFDEIDSMAPRRDKTMDAGRRTVGQLLSLMDGIEDRGRVVVIGTTNLIGAIDPALRRPGRFGREIEFPRPSREGRREILEIHKPAVDFADEVSLDNLVEKTNGWTGAHIESLFEEIGEILLKEDRDKGENPTIHRMDVERAYERVQAQINNKEAQRRREQEAEEGAN